MKNSTNNAKKRTANQISRILKANGIDLVVTNCGDGRTFEVADVKIKTRFRVKKAGFILCRSIQGQKYLQFKAF